MLNETNKLESMNKVSCRIFKKKKHILNAVFASVISATIAVSSAHAAPTGGNVVGGDASIKTDGNTTNINQSTQNAIINWQGFSIGVNEVVNFFNGSGATLNRVVGQGVSEIFGALNATGSVYVINENGVTVGPNGQVAVGGSFVASTHDITNQDFMNGGDLTFSGNSDSAIVNLGKVESGDNVYLIGSEVFNKGVIKAGGDVGLIAADEVVLMVKDDHGARYQIVSTNDGVMGNPDLIDSNPLASAMNGGGQNSGARIVNGRIVTNAGKIEAAGDVAAIAVQGDTILKSGSSISGRNVNVGGYYQGGANLPASMKYASARTTIEKNAHINAEKQAVVWADDRTLFAGNINAHSAEVSGKENLNLAAGWSKNIKVAKDGELLFDPNDIEIVAGNGSVINSEIVSDNTIYSDDVENFLNGTGGSSGSNLTIQTSDTGNGNGDIDVNADIAWSGDTKLTMKAHRDININGKTIDASASTGNAGYIAYAARDINVNDGSVIKSGQSGTIELNAATTNPFANSASAGRVGNWKNGTGTVNFNGNSEITTKNLTVRSGKDANGARSDFGTNVALKNHNGEFGAVQLHGFENVDVNVNGTNDDYKSNLSFLVNAKNINIDENYDVTGAYMLNAAAYDDNTNNFVEHNGEYNSLGSLNGDGWKENSGTVNFAKGTKLDLCCGVTINSGKDANGNRVDLTKSDVEFGYNRDYNVYNWYQVQGFNKFEGNFEGGKLSSNTYVDIKNEENIIDFDIEAGKDIVSNTYNKTGSNGDVLIVADRDTEIAAGADIVASEDVTIVVDEQNPDRSSGYGDGKLVMDKDATITSGGATALYTAKQDQNDIAGTINGSKFTPGEEFASSAIEQWLTYYQETNGKSGSSPFKVLYKNDGLPALPAGLDCEEESGNPACENFVKLMDNRREYRVAMSGSGQDVGEATLAQGSSEEIRSNEFYTAMSANYVDTTLTTEEQLGLVASVPLELLQISLLDVAIPGIQGLAELVVSPVTSQF